MNIRRSESYGSGEVERWRGGKVGRRKGGKAQRWEGAKVGKYEGGKVGTSVAPRVLEAKGCKGRTLSFLAEAGLSCPVVLICVRRNLYFYQAKPVEPSFGKMVKFS